MRKGIVIFYQHIVREYEMCLRVKECLGNALGIDADIRVFSIDFEWAKAKRFAQSGNVVAVLFPWMRLRQHETFAYPFFFFNPQVAFFSLNHEQIGSSVTTPLMLPQTDFCKFSVIHFAWTEYFKRVLVETGVPEENVLVRGNARLDSLASPGFTRSQLAEEFGLCPEKEWVLFAESRYVGVAEEAQYPNDWAECGISKQSYEASVAFQTESIKAFKAQLDDLDNRVFERYEFVYRLHPGQLSAFDMNDRIHVISSYPIGEWLNSVQLYLTWGSTSAFEASMVGVPVLMHDPTGPGDQYKAAGLNEFDSIVQLADIINEDVLLKARKKVTFRVHERYIGVPGGNAAAAIAKSVVEVCESAKDCNYIPEWNANVARRKVLFESATKVSCSSRLLQIIKLPRSAYREYSDIPFLSKNLEPYGSIEAAN